MLSKLVLVTRGSGVDGICTILNECGIAARAVDPNDDWPTLYRHAAGVLFTGGADIHPREYHENVVWARPGNPQRDAMELALARRALADRKPVLGICRGMQVLAVAAGGTLYQDIELDTGVTHASVPHAIRISPYSRLARCLGLSGRYQVNSYHHQAVAHVPRGWRVVAESLDGVVVEAIEHPTQNAIGVQWHPEILGDLAARRLFAQFIRGN